MSSLSHCTRNWIGTILIFLGGSVLSIKTRCCRNIFRPGCRCEAAHGRGAVSWAWEQTQGAPEYHWRRRRPRGRDRLPVADSCPRGAGQWEGGGADSWFQSSPWLGQILEKARDSRARCRAGRVWGRFRSARGLDLPQQCISGGVPGGSPTHRGRHLHLVLWIQCCL